jgi:hypothetical protein
LHRESYFYWLNEFEGVFVNGIEFDQVVFEDEKTFEYCQISFYLVTVSEEGVWNIQFSREIKKQDLLKDI